MFLSRWCSDAWVKSYKWIPMTIVHIYMAMLPSYGTIYTSKHSTDETYIDSIFSSQVQQQGLETKGWVKHVKHRWTELPSPVAMHPIWVSAPNLSIRCEGPTNLAMSMNWRRRLSIMTWVVIVSKCNTPYIREFLERESSWKFGVRYQNNSLTKLNVCNFDWSEFGS